MGYLKSPCRTVSVLTRGSVFLSVHELRVALGSCHDHIHPDPHGLRGGGHHEIQSVVRLHTEGQGGVGALHFKRHNQISMKRIFYSVKACALSVLYSLGMSICRIFHAK